MDGCIYGSWMDGWMGIVRGGAYGCFAVWEEV